jgi:hypothetical protein
MPHFLIRARVDRSSRRLRAARFGAQALQCAPQAERIGLHAHEADHVADVDVQRQPELLGSTSKVLAIHALANALSFIRLTTDDASRSSRLLLGLTSAAAVMKPDISSQA